MPIASVVQKDILLVDDKVRLRKFDGDFSFALQWYQDIETVRLVDGKTTPYNMEKLKRMYTYLNEHGELYFIEIINENGEFFPIGDITFWQEDMPIVIGDTVYRGQGIGRKIVTKLIERAKNLGYKYLCVREIYSYNIGSQKLFEGLGFHKYKKTIKGYSYRLELK